jgi:hypothetical protein
MRVRFKPQILEYFDPTTGFYQQTTHRTEATIGQEQNPRAHWLAEEHTQVSGSEDQDRPAAGSRWHRPSQTQSATATERSKLEISLI